MKSQKIDKLKKIKAILDKKLKEDKKINKKTGRGLGTWLLIINRELSTSSRINNNRELASIFKLFKFKRSTSETTHEGGFRRIIYYRYLGGYKNGNIKKSCS